MYYSSVSLFLPCCVYVVTPKLRVFIHLDSYIYHIVLRVGEVHGVGQIERTSVTSQRLKGGQTEVSISVCV